MKTSPLLALLKYHLGMAWPFLLLSLFYGGFFAYQQRQLGQDHLFSLNFEGPLVFLFMVPFMGIDLIFTQGVPTNAPGRNPLGTLEFFFTRAIARSSLFWLRTALFLLFSLFPLLIVSACSYFKPPIRIELPYNTTTARETTKQFYLTHFDGSYLQDEDKDPTYPKTYVVLPHGEVEVSAFTFVIVFTGVLLFQIVSFVSLPTRPWVKFVSFLAVITIITIGGSPWGWTTTPTPYEASLAWVTQHPPLALTALALLTVLAQLYCRHRFVNTEILS